MISFIIGCIVGGAVGILTMSCCVAAKNADKHIDYTDSDK